MTLSDNTTTFPMKHQTEFMRHVIQVTEKDESTTTLVNLLLSNFVSTMREEGTDSVSEHFMIWCVAWDCAVRGVRREVSPIWLRKLYLPAQTIILHVVDNLEGGDEAAIRAASEELKRLLGTSLRRQDLLLCTPIRLSSVRSITSPSSASMLDWIENGTPSDSVGHDGIPSPPPVEVRIGREAASSLADMFDMMDEETTFATI